MESIIHALLSASGLAYLLFALGLLVNLKPHWRHVSWGLLAASGLVLLTASSGMVASALMSPLEYRYPAIHDAHSQPRVKHIVVLTGYAADDKDMPLTGRMHFASAFRVMMALQLQRGCPGCEVIVSGNPTTAKVMGESLVALGLPPKQLKLETASTTTGASATNLQRLLREPFFLVTSAGHMARSVAAMKRAGLSPIPAPTDYQTPKDWRHAELRPSAQSLFASDLAIHEYVGLLWYRLKGAI